MSFRIVAFLVLAAGAAGCTPAFETGATKAKMPDKTPTASTVPIEKRIADHIAWNNRAADVLSKVVDKKSADAHSAELVSLVKQAEARNAMASGDKRWEWSKEKKDALDKQFKADMEASQLRFMKAAGPFDNYSTRKDLVPYIAEKYGVDIRRMKTVAKK